MWGGGYMHSARSRRKGDAHQVQHPKQRRCGRPLPPPGCTPPQPAPHALLGGAGRRPPLVLRQSLVAPSVAASWAAGGGREASLSLWPPGAAPPQAETPPWATRVLPASGRLTIAAVSELAVLGNLQFGGVGGGEAVTGLHAVPLFELRQGAHEARVGRVQGGDALLLWNKEGVSWG